MLPTEFVCITPHDRLLYRTNACVEHVEKFEFVDCPPCQCDGSDYDEVKDRPCSIM